MFLSWGSSRKVVFVGDAGIRHCGACDKETMFSAFIGYTLRHLYWVFRWVTGRDPVLVCGNCGANYAAAAEDCDPAKADKAIPLWDRRGWIAGVGGIAVLVTAVSFAAAAVSTNEKTYVADPHVGDLYEANLAKIFAKPEEPQMYGAIRVVGTDAETVEVQIANVYYKDLRGVRRDVSRGRTGSASYYAPEHLMFPRDSISRMYAEGVIEAVIR